MPVHQNKVLLVRTYFSIAVIVIALLVLIGWNFNLFILKSILSGYIAMNPLTAINLILIASGVLLIKKKSSFSIITLRIITFLVMGLMALKFADVIFLTGFKPDKIFFSESLGTNQMAVPTAFNFIFLSFALFLSSKQKNFAITISQILTLVCLALSSIYICAYIYNLNSIIGTIVGTPMALNTAITFLLLSFALLLSKPEKGFMKVITSHSLGGIITRKALPLIILIPFILGYLRILGQKFGLYNTEFGAAIIVITNSVLCGTIMWYFGRELNTINSEWKNTELNLRLSESKFSNAFNFSGIGMALVSLKGEWIDTNESLCELLGYSRDEIIALNYKDITSPEDYAIDINYINQLIDGEINTYHTEKQYIHKNGSPVWVTLTASMVRDENNIPKFFVFQITDISQTKKLIVELKTNNEILSYTTQDLENKIHQLEEFNGIVAHNLRGPAGNIQMLTELAIDATSEEERIEMLEIIKKSSVVLNQTLLELLAVLEVRLNKNISFEDCNIIEITEKIEQMLIGEIISKKAQIITSFESPIIKYPKVYLESIFYNMISNALKYSKKNEPPVIHISTTTINNKIEIRFKDNGLGIDLDRYGGQMFKLNQIFHKGFDSKGVGLFMTKTQIETFGGAIEVESTPDEGSEFKITI